MKALGRIVAGCVLLLAGWSAADLIAGKPPCTGKGVACSTWGPNPPSPYPGYCCQDTC